MHNKNLYNISKNIRKENPIFTDKILNLLYEYFDARTKQDNEKNWKILKNDNNFNEIIQGLITK